MKTLRFVLGDQLSRSVSSLSDLQPGDVVLLAEVADETGYVRHHKQKIVLVLAAMRRFAAELRDEGVQVDYVELESPGNTGSFAGELARATARWAPDVVVVTEPGEWRVLEALRSIRLDAPLDIRADDRFFCSRAEFELWAKGRSSYRMEFFYREMRRAHGFLMQGDEPEGGRWNFDAENRKRLPKGHVAPPALRFAPDAATREVIAMVARRFSHHFGDLEEFGWAVSRDDALAALAYFIAHNLAPFGDFQDSMAAGEPFIHHAALSPYLNIGLLAPREVCEAAERAYREGSAPLNAVEGFIRQILGWREYVRGIYWLRMPAYARGNALEARRPLPWFYWSGETALNCVAEVVQQTRRHAYAHHIQRLMVVGNLALLAGLAPAEVEEWYLIVFADAYEWVELPNTHGMALFADNGVMASKPYAASGAYIHKMSDYCGRCRYSPAIKRGPGACPFNPLYWAFLIRNRAKLAPNPRMAIVYKRVEGMSAAERDAILAEAEGILDGPEFAPKPA